MNKLILMLVLVLPFTANADEFDVKAFLDNVHVRVGVAYKINESNLWFDDVKMRKAYTARVGAWYRFENVVSKKCYVDLGFDHHSQYSEGGPFNDRDEYAKFEFFLDGTCRLSALFN